MAPLAIWLLVFPLDESFAQFITLYLELVIFYFQVKVMLRVTGRAPPSDSPQFFTVDSRKKQITLLDPSICGAPPAPEDRRVGVTAPKMFAFDAIFTPEDSQVRGLIMDLSLCDCGVCNIQLMPVMAISLHEGEVWRREGGRLC